MWCLHVFSVQKAQLKVRWGGCGIVKIHLCSDLETEKKFSCLLAFSTLEVAFLSSLTIIVGMVQFNHLQ